MLRPSVQAQDGRRDAVVLAILILAGIIYTVCQAVLLPTIGALARGVHSSVTSTTWVLTVYILSGGIATPILGRLGDMFGKRRALLAMLAVVSAGLLLSGVSDSLVLIIVGRALAGISSGIFPLGAGIVRDEFPRERVVTALGVMSVSNGVGTALGVLIAGPITTHLSIHWLFWIPLMMAVPTLVAAWHWIPESPIRAGGTVDWAGATLLVGGLVAVLLAISEATHWGWGSSRTLALFAIGAVLLVVWVRFERHRRDPLIDISTMALPAVWRANAVAGFVGFSMFTAFAVIPRFAQEPASTGWGFGASVQSAGLYLVPATITMMISAPMAGTIERWIGSRLALVVGCVCSGLGFVLLAVSPAVPWHVVLGSALLGIGLGVTYAALPNMIIMNVPREQTAAATGINTILRAIGGAVGVALCTTIITQSATGRAAPTLSAYQLSFWLCAGVVAAAAWGSLLLPRRELGVVIAD